MVKKVNEAYWEDDRNSKKEYKAKVKYKLFDDDKFDTFSDTYYIDSDYSLDEVATYITRDMLLVCGGGYSTKNIEKATVTINGKVVYELDRTNDEELSESKNRGRRNSKKTNESKKSKRVKEDYRSFKDALYSMYGDYYKDIDDLIDGGYELALDYLRNQYEYDVNDRTTFNATRADVSDDELRDWFSEITFTPEDFGTIGTEWEDLI